MHLKTVVLAFVLPFVARAAEEPQSTVTSTTYQTLTRTVTLVRAPTLVAGATYSNTSGVYPTNASQGFSSLPTNTATATFSGVPIPSQTGAASSLGGAQVAVMAMAGAVAAVLL